MGPQISGPPKQKPPIELKKSVYKVVEEAIFYKYGDFGVRHLKGQVAGPILARVPPAGLGGKVPCAIKHPKCEKVKSKFKRQRSDLTSTPIALNTLCSRSLASLTTPLQ